MDNIKKGDAVIAKSLNKNLVFYVTDILDIDSKNPVVILKGATLRIQTSSNIEDLEYVDKDKLNSILKKFDNKIEIRAEKILEKYIQKKQHKEMNKFQEDRLKESGFILHLDGDKKYATKSSKVYSKFGLNAVVKNIPENKQPYEIKELLNKYNPDILILTGHDGMIKKGKSYNDIYNYRNSRYFVRTVIEARKWEQGVNKLVIFAGACQSYYEAIMEAGANFASSPARILIDFMDPLIIAQKIATSSEMKYITMKDIRDYIRNGERGISGIGAYGKYALSI